MDLLSATALLHPLHRPRYSDQTWINQRALADPVLDKVTERYKVFRLLPAPTPNCAFSSEAWKSGRGHEINGQFALWDVSAGNHGSCIGRKQYPVLGDRYHYHDSLRVQLTELELATGDKARSFRRDEGVGYLSCSPVLLLARSPCCPPFLFPGWQSFRRLPSRTVIFYNHSLYLWFSLELWNLLDFLEKLYTEVREFR